VALEGGPAGGLQGVVLERLYAADLAGWPRDRVISPGTPPSLDLTPPL